MLNPGKKEEEARQARATIEARQTSSTQSQDYRKYVNHLFDGGYTPTEGEQWTEHEFEIRTGQKLKFSQLNPQEQEKVIEEINNRGKEDAAKF